MLIIDVAVVIIAAAFVDVVVVFVNDDVVVVIAAAFADVVISMNYLSFRPSLVFSPRRKG